MKKEEIIIMIRTMHSSWRKGATCDSLEEAEKYWRANIKGRGITAWCEFVSPEDAEKMLQDSHYVPALAHK